MQRLLDRFAAQPPALVRLYASPAESERRLRRRGAPPELTRPSRSRDPHAARACDLTIDTTHLTIPEAAARIRRALPTWPPPAAPPPSHLARPTDSPSGPGHAVLICGPTPVGKSAVAWQLLMRSLAGNVPTAYLDLAQIGWLHPAADHDAVLELKTRNLAAMWPNFARHGARRLIISGALDDPRDLDRYQAALPAVHIRAYHLTATTTSLIHRAVLRGQGHATELPGDDLRDQPQEHLEQLAVAASAKAAATRYPAPVTSVSTDNREPAEIAADIAATAFQPWRTKPCR